MESMAKVVCFVMIVGLWIGSSGYAGVLFSDTYECEQATYVGDMQSTACDAGRSGVYAGVGMLQDPVGSSWKHQVTTTNELLLYGGKVAPNVDMSGLDSMGGISVNVDINPARGADLTNANWAGISIGGSGLSGAPNDGFGVIFRKSGTIQAWNNGVRIVNDDVTWNANPDDVYHAIQIIAKDAGDDNPFDGVGTTTFEIFVDGSSIYSIELDGADYPDNYVTLQGSGNNNYYDNLVISQIPEPATLMLLGLGAVAMKTRRRR